jgi:curved DNA-binding protein CbpA
MFENYFKILGIPADADEKTLKKAFRQLALKYHPDVNKAADANQRFQEICEAYEVVLRHIQNQTTFYTYRREEPEYTYEDVLREAREAAYKRAKMKYDKMKAEKEIFEQSGFHDILLFFKYAGRVLAIPFGFFLILIPVSVAYREGIKMFFALFIFWVLGGLLLIHIFRSRKTWFRQGKFRYTFSDFMKFYDFKPLTGNPSTDCFYCSGRMADSRAHKLTFHKIRDIKISNEGVYQHYVGYKRKFKDVIIPRSVKARKVHFAQSVIKVVCLLGSLFFVPFPDFIWRFTFGIFTGLILSTLLVLVTRTRSKTDYLLNYYLILKVTIWMTVIISQTTLHRGFILECTEFTALYLVLLAFFGDMVLDLILRAFPFYNRIYQPVMSQGPLINGLFRDGYQNFLDIPLWSTVYPLFMWFV